jgi:hypothetical protein
LRGFLSHKNTRLDYRIQGIDYITGTQKWKKHYAIVETKKYFVLYPWLTLFHPDPDKKKRLASLII